MKILSNSTAIGHNSPDGNDLCATFEAVIGEAPERLWIAVPWAYSSTNDPWIRGFIADVAHAKKRGVDVRVYLRPDPANRHAVSVWQAAGVRVVQATARVRYLHTKAVVTEKAVIVSTANITDTDLYRNANTLTVSSEREAIDDAAASMLFLEEQTAVPSMEHRYVRGDTILPIELRRYLAVDKLNPMQSEAIPRVLHDTANLVVAAPTGAGKTLVAEVALLKECVQKGKAGIYLVPMRAIASEKQGDWQRLQQKGLSVYKTTGEDEAFSLQEALKADIIVTTPEKLDSITRRTANTRLADRVGVIVVDEVHLVDDETRGPALEALLTRIHLAFPAARLIAMSGTILNAQTVADWLQADLYQSTWRPVTLITHMAPYIESGDRTRDEQERDAITARIAQETVDEDGAVLVFCGSRRGVETCTLSIGDHMSLGMPAHGIQVDHPVLRRSLDRGVVFHHAGLTSGDRATVEQLYRSGVVKVLVATSTVAAGVNLPARVVIVRDLQLGSTDMSAPVLGQMAGQAGRAGLETEGRCFVLTGQTSVRRTEGLLRGRPIASHLGDDLETHLNAEIALGIVRSRDDADAWYRRTMHAHTPGTRIDIMAALTYLLDNNFIVEQSGGLEPASLGRSTSDAMISVQSAQALDAFVARCRPETPGVAALEQDLLLAACGLPIEFATLPSYKAEEPTLKDIAAQDRRMRDWPMGRVRYLATAASLLSGIAPQSLPFEAASARATAVRNDVPRFLRFIARRADERRPGAPTLLVAAHDLAVTLEYGIAERGAGFLIEVIKRSYPPDDMRKRRVQKTYAALRAQDIETVEAATPHLPPVSQSLATARPAGPLSIESIGEALIIRFAHGRSSMCGHVRVRFGEIDDIISIDGSDPREIRLPSLEKRGAYGLHQVTIEILLTSLVNPGLWAYAAYNEVIDIPRPQPDYVRIHALLRDTGGMTYQRKAQDGKPNRFSSWPWRPPSPPMGNDAVPDCVGRAALLLSQRLSLPPDKAHAVDCLLRPRKLLPGYHQRRPLRGICGEDQITRAEGAHLAAALLRHMKVEAQVMRARLDGEESLLCAWRYHDTWYGLPIWPAHLIETHDQVVQGWRPVDSVAAPVSREGWSVIETYNHLESRQLSFVVADDTTLSTRPLCPECRSPMKKRAGYNVFWGCERYPTCKGIRSIEQAS